jgi:hypothetical protein
MCGDGPFSALQGVSRARELLGNEYFGVKKCDEDDF